MDGRTRKILVINGCMHTKINVARLYLPRKEGGRGLISIEKCVNEESKSLYGYLIETAEWMLLPKEEERGENQEMERESPTWRVYETNSLL